MDIQWFPGHMAKTRRIIGEDLKLVDLVVEIVDARVPLSSRNPDIQNILNGKKEILVLNKSDMAEPKVTEAWVRYFKEGKGGSNVISVFSLNALKNQEFKHIIQQVRELGLPESKRYKQFNDTTVRAMVIGIPNTGKSTFINTFNQKKKTVTGDRPGVTRGRQWVHTPWGVTLLDTPGVLWPKFEDPMVGLKLAFTGAVKSEVLNKEELALKLIEWLRENRPELLTERYGVDLSGYPIEVYEAIAQKRGFIVGRGNIDYERTATTILTEFRSGKLGRISLEEPV